VTGTAAAATAARVGRTALDRFLAVVPVAVAGLVLISLLLWEAAALKAPIVFGDELEWSMISRAIAHTGHGARLGEPTGFRSFYAYLVAPSWWLSSTHASYTALKYLDTLVMAAAAVPVYLLSRTIVSRRWATAVALGTLCTSAYFYAPLILPEVLAYPTFALCAYVSVQALAGRGRRWTVSAILLSLLAVGVRSQLAMALGALLLAAACLWVVGPNGKRMRRGWSVADYVGASLLLVGAFVVANGYASPHLQQWSHVTQSFKGRIFHLGLESGSALALGLGVLPAIGGLASLWVPERRTDPRWRAFAAYLGASIVTFGTYTGVKAAWNSTQVFTRVEERNLIYLGPLLLLGTAVVLSARRAWLPGLLVAGGFVAWLVLGYGYQLDYPYSDSPGYGIAAMANRAFFWNQADIRWAVAVAVVVSMAVLLLHRVARVPGGARNGVYALTALTVSVWMAAGQVTSARGAQRYANAHLSGLAAIGAEPFDWVDQATGGEGVTYLGQDLGLGDANGLWLTEFWNQSIKHVYTLDSSSPGPGPSVTPGLAKPDGTLTADPGLPYVLADGGVTLAAQQVGKARGSLVLYRLGSHPWRLKRSVIGLSPDGWTVGSNETTYADGTFAYYGPERSTGTLSVQIGRSFCPTGAPIAHATVRVGSIALNDQQKPVVARARFVRHIVVPTCADHPHSTRTLEFRVAPPVAVTVHVDPTIRPADYAAGGDTRLLGAQLGFGFSP
jgi:hypothetical protein